MASIPLIYNVRNLWVRKTSTLLTVAGIALASGVLLVVLMLVSGLQYALVQSGSADNAIVLRKSSQSETMSGLTRDSVSIIQAIPEIALSSDGGRLVAAEAVVGVNLLRRGQTDTHSGSNVTLRGITPASLRLREGVRVTQGRAPVPGKAEIIAGRNAARGFQDCQVGGTIRMGGIDWKVVGVFEAGGTAFESEIWGDADLVMEAFGRPGGFSSVTFTMNDPRLDLAAVKARLESDPRLNVEVKRESQYYADASTSLSLLIQILGSVLVVLFTFGAILGAMVTMFAFVGARTTEIGTLRALGFSRRSILLSFLVESAILAVAGGIIACLPALFLQQFTFSTTNFSSFTDITWSFRATPRIVLATLIFSTVMGLAGGLLPAIRAARLPIITALREA